MLKEKLQEAQAAALAQRTRNEMIRDRNAGNTPRRPVCVDMIAV
jgi:hypothetical protein